MMQKRATRHRPSSNLQQGSDAAAEDEHMETPSRQLHFEQISKAEEDDDENNSSNDKSSEDEIWEDDQPTRDAQRVHRARRRTTRWTEDEELFLTEAVQKYGTGKWISILRAGKDVFLNTRTNSDLKDKWRILSKRHVTFPHEDASHTGTSTIADGAVDSPKRARVRKNSQRANLAIVSLRAEQDSSIGLEGSIDNSSSSTQESEIEQNIPFDATQDLNEIYLQSEINVSSAVQRKIKFSVATDDTFPMLETISINVDSCPTVATLKSQLTERFLEDSPLTSNLLLVAIDSRTLLQDEDMIVDVVEQHGSALYLLYDP